MKDKYKKRLNNLLYDWGFLKSRDIITSDSLIKSCNVSGDKIIISSDNIISCIDKVNKVNIKSKLNIKCLTYTNDKIIIGTMGKQRHISLPNNLFKSNEKINSLTENLRNMNQQIELKLQNSNTISDKIKDQYLKLNNKINSIENNITILNNSLNQLIESIYLFNLPLIEGYSFNGSKELSLKGHTENIKAIFISDNNIIISGSKDKTIKLWDYQKKKNILTLKGHTKTVRCICTINEKLIISGSADKTLRIWDIEKEKNTKILRGHTETVTCCIYINDVIISGSKDKTVKVWDIKKAEVIYNYTSHTSAVRCLNYINNNQIVSAGDDSIIRIWEVSGKKGKELETLKGHEDGVFDTTIDKDNNIISCGGDKKLKIWDETKSIELKDKQMEIIEALVTHKRDTIGLLPTGYGKSMTYLIPPLITNKTCIIISPLISLMDDQKEKLIEKDIPVAALHGNNYNKEKEVFRIIDGEIKIVYMSPEFIIQGDGIELIETLNNDKMIGLFAIDEAHCISTWGHDFRNDYLCLSKVRDKFPKIPILAVTATATVNVVDDIIKYTKLKEPLLVRGNFDRPNLSLYFKDLHQAKALCKSVDDNVIYTKLIDPYIEKYIKCENEDRIIIYTGSRKDATELNQIINNKWKKLCGVYHAGLSKKMRNIIQNKFSSGEIKIIVSTIAFGMGIDQIVRCVIIFGAPSSIEEYYQQIGRAGRDHKEAETVLFFDYGKIEIGKTNVSKFKDPKVRTSKRRCYQEMAALFYTKTCRRRFILEYLGQVPKFFNCRKCDNCLNTNKDISKKVYKWMIKDDKFNDVFTKEEISRMKDLNLITNKLTPNGSFLNWKRLITVNNIKKNSIVEKYKIFI